MKCVISAFKFKSCLHKNIFSLKTTLSKKVSAQDSKFAGILDRNQLGFKCL